MRNQYTRIIRRIISAVFIFSILLFPNQIFAQLVGSVAELNNVLCFGSSTGSVSVIGSGGTAPYEYKIDEGDYQGTGTFSDLPAGTYTITVRDYNLATVTVSVIITQPTESISIIISSQTNIECEGNESGEIDVSVSGGTPAYSYEWSTSDGYGLEATLEDQSGLSAGTYILKVTDANGCTSLISTTITHVGETTPPVIIGGAQGTSECQGSDPGSNPHYIEWRDNFAGITATDNCGISSIHFEEGEWVTNGCVYENTVVFVVTDNNNNTSTSNLSFRIVDTIPPILTGGSDGSAAGSGGDPGSNELYISWRDNFAGLSTEDICGIPALTYDEGVWTSTNDADVITVHFMATDGCGLLTITQHTFTITKTDQLSITCPADITIDCISDLPAPDISQVTAIGEGVVITHMGDVTDGNICPEIISRTYIATDENSNTAECTQMIIIQDNTPPVISCPGPLSVGSIEEVPAADPAQVTATDNCAVPPIITFISDVFDQTICSELITRTYMATDQCGNETICTQLIIINDLTPPVIQCPEPIDVSCFDDIPDPDASLIVASDNCGSAEVQHMGDISDGNSCPETIIRVYRAEDETGNYAECIQTITINDLTPPVLIDVPDDLFVDCDAIPTPPNVTAADDCSSEDNITVIYTELINSVDNCDGVIVRQWEAADLCGNFVRDIQTIIVSPSTGIDQTIQAGNLFIYPNPSRGRFALEYSSPTPGIVGVTISDMSGRIILNEIHETVNLLLSRTIQLNACPAGIYYLRLISETEIVCRKIIVN